MKTTSKTCQLILFFVLSFLISWATWIPAFLYPSFPKLIVLIGLFGPAFAAIIVEGLTKGKDGVHDLFRRILIWRYAVKWYLVALFLIPFVFALAIFISSWFSKSDLTRLFTHSPWYFVAASFIWLMFINSGEEIGWRGFALPYLQDVTKNGLRSSLILGVIWALWHLPEYLVPGQSGFPYILFFLFILGISMIYTVLFNKTGGSLFSALLLHASTDIVPRIIDLSVFTVNLWIIVVIITWVAAAIFYFSSNEE